MINNIYSPILLTLYLLFLCRTTSLIAPHLLQGTHLGHNLPDKNGNRYCINLVSIAGYPAGNNNNQS